MTDVAIHAVQNGLSIRKAEHTFGVDEGTLTNRTKGHHGKKNGRPVILTETEELYMVQLLKTAS